MPCRLEDWSLAALAGIFTLPKNDNSSRIARMKIKGAGLCMLIYFTFTKEKLTHVYGGHSLDLGHEKSGTYLTIRGR